MLEPDDFPEDEIVAELYCHVIFWTRRLQPALTPEMLAAAQELMDQAMFAIEGEALAAGGAAEHLHVLVRWSQDHALQEAIDALRRASAAWVSAEGGTTAFPWHEDEVSVTVSPSDLETAREFIESQASHHEIVTFQTELKAIFDEHGFDYDPRELWE